LQQRWLYLHGRHQHVCPHLQEKLHQNLCRQRSLVSVGTHDLATLKPPFTYEALPPAAISFVPLKQDREFRADELLDVSVSSNSCTA
jgi:phenylalanyl-tRNA synthetase beta subunit